MARGENYNEKVLGNFDFENFDPTSVKKQISIIDELFVKEIKNLLGNEFNGKKINLINVRKIIKEFHYDVNKTIVDHRDGVMMPYGLGHLMIAACPKSTRKKFIDFKKTKEYGQTIYRTSPETDEMYPTVKYSAKLLNGRKLRNSRLWKFGKSHRLRDMLSIKFKENPYKYYALNKVEKLAYYAYQLKKTIKK